MSSMQRIEKIVSHLQPSTCNAMNDGLIVRELNAGDYHRGFLDLLSQLTQVGTISEAQFRRRLAEMQRLTDTYKVAVIVDPAKDLVIACATLIIERKFVHECGLVGHVEDVVVNKTYRGRRLGLRVVDQLKTWSKDAGCYKIILDCAAHNVAFYNKLGFVKKEEQMACYFK